MKKQYAILFKKDLKPLWELGIVVGIFGGGLLAVAYVIQDHAIWPKKVLKMLELSNLLSIYSDLILDIL